MWGRIRSNFFRSFIVFNRVLLNQSHSNYLSSTASSSSASFGIAFDIDGVLIRGGKQLPRAKRVIEILRENHVPHIFLTNGGGCMEEQKAKNLGQMLELEIDPAHMVLSHTPMREIARIYGDKRVLIMGSYDVWNVARQYGFKKVVSIEDLAKHQPTQYPFFKWDHQLAPYHEAPIEAILIMHDPVNWAPDIQIAVDTLIGGDPLGSGRPCGTQTPLFVSNDDFTFSAAYPFPRFAAGAFSRCLKLLYEEYTGKKLEVTRYGKPHAVTYEYAEDLLNEIAGNNDTNTRLETVYGIGDNPMADIAGANNAGNHWRSILVRTGIYTGEKDPEHEPDVHTTCVWEALEHIFKEQGLQVPKAS